MCSTMMWRSSHCCSSAEFTCAHLCSCPRLSCTRCYVSYIFKFFSFLFFNFHSFVQISTLQFLYLLCDIHLINFKFRAFLCNLISGALFLSFHVLLICTLKCVMSLLIFLFQILWNTNEDSCCSGSMWNLHVAHVARTAWLHLGTPFFPNRSSIFQCFDDGETSVASHG